MPGPQAVVAEARPPGRRRRKLVTGLVAVAMPISAFLLWTRKVSDVPVFHVRFYQNPYDEELFLRYEHPGEDLLITRRETIEDRAVYRYKIGSAQLEPATPHDWKAATGRVTRSDIGPPLSSRIWDLMSTKGKKRLTAYGSPDGMLVAVLTTDGWKRPATRGWWVSFGGGHGGQHRIEIFEAVGAVHRGAQYGSPSRREGGSMR